MHHIIPDHFALFMDDFVKCIIKHVSENRKQLPTSFLAGEVATSCRQPGCSAQLEQELLLCSAIFYTQECRTAEWRKSMGNAQSALAEGPNFNPQHFSVELEMLLVRNPGKQLPVSVGITELQG